MLYSGKNVFLRPLQKPHLRRISALCTARPLSLVLDMSAPAALLCLELHPHLEQRSLLVSAAAVPALYCRCCLQLQYFFLFVLP
ncbi:hypothetical protein [Neisseria sp.]|uniref:hypothetical protein n=1 Tax=Neisseria sp. TaxID=192066 RepID=UPI0026DB8575|nr:hypothetical protein [Neisseria sp.]MDO4906571.1 hypothetical protein [Neisseria sp.]